MSQLANRVAALEARRSPDDSRSPRLFIGIVDACQRDDGSTGSVPLDVRGYTAGPSAQGPRVEVLRREGESREALQERCKHEHPEYIVWMSLDMEDRQIG